MCDILGIVEVVVDHVGDQNLVHVHVHEVVDDIIGKCVDVVQVLIIGIEIVIDVIVIEIVDVEVMVIMQ